MLGLGCADRNQLKIPKCQLLAVLLHFPILVSGVPVKLLTYVVVHGQPTQSLLLRPVGMRSEVGRASASARS